MIAKVYNKEYYHIIEEYSKNPGKFSVSENVDDGVEESKANKPACVCVDNKNLKSKLCVCWCPSKEEPFVN